MAEELNGGDVGEEVGSVVRLELDGDFAKTAGRNLAFRWHAVEHRSPVQILSPDQRPWRERERDEEAKEKEEEEAEEEEEMRQSNTEVPFKF